MKTIGTLLLLAGIFIILFKTLGGSALPQVVRFEDTLIPIVSEISGRVHRVSIKEGSQVSVGDAILEFDITDLLRRKASIESRVHFAEMTRPEARSALSDLYGELQHVNLDLGSLTITSPVDGEIISIAALRSGERLVAGTAVALVLRKYKGRWRP